MSQLADGQWNLSYAANGPYPGSDFTFGTFGTGFYLLEPYEITYGTINEGEAALPREDGVRLGQDFRSTSTITFEVGVDSVDDAHDGAGRHSANLGAVSAMAQAWRADAVRRRFAAPAVLRTMQGGRARLFYGRPRKFGATGSRLTRQGYTPVVAEFVCADDAAYDDVEQTIRVDVVPPPHRGLIGPLKTPLSMVGAGATRLPGQIQVSGTLPTWPVVTFYGPISQPACEVLGRWNVGLDLTLSAGERVTIDPRPWARTVLRNGTASVAGSLTRSSPRLADLRLPLGRQDAILRGADGTGTAYMTVAWRGAYAYL
ncbi:hypothetical protein G3I60_05365 [Streptomyces sp. SID13666]|uniref:hypothetical protein n=1 Tax=Streptomyces sp. SID13666 TaxID=2706054 RepID=UPI0013BFE56A|nr:hypothetical protein [Streptomyces sp. SID13666]NEA53600.1 hypothetical protein [Streptomyces sp. SID13666]